MQLSTTTRERQKNIAIGPTFINTSDQDVVLYGSDREIFSNFG